MERIYRQLTQQEIDTLQLKGNESEDWEQILVGEPFCCNRVRNNYFSGKIVIGAIDNGTLQDEGLTLPEGIYNSRLKNCIIGDHSAIHNVHFLAHYNVGDNVLLFNIDEMTSIRDKVNRIEPMNECGGRWIVPYNGMLIADAYLWAKYRDHAILMNQLESYTKNMLTSDNGCLGVVGDNCVIMNSSTR